MSGGCAQNSLANGKITSISNFEEVWVQPAAGDAGGALGAALLAHIEKTNIRPKPMANASFGLSYSNELISAIISKDKRLEDFDVKYIESDEKLEHLIVDALLKGNK